MKAWIAIILVLTMSFTLIACGHEEISIQGTEEVLSETSPQHLPISPDEDRISEGEANPTSNERTANTTDQKKPEGILDDSIQDNELSSEGSEIVSTPTDKPDSDTSHSSDASEYSIEYVSFREGLIEIDYPQVHNYRDSSVESIINNDIKNIAYREYNEYESSTLLSELSLHVYGEVTFTGKEIICVRFTAFRYVDGSPYPVSYASSATYDLGSGNRLEIGDFVANASEFVNMFKEHTKAVAVGGDYIEEGLAKAFSRVLFEDVENGRVYSDDELMATIFGDEGMGKPGAGLYFTNGNLCLLFPVHRNAGTSIEMDIDLKLIPSSILKRSIL